MSSNRLQQWYQRSLGRRDLSKTRPILRFPGLDVPDAPPPKILSTPTSKKIYRAKEGKAWTRTKFGPAAGLFSTKTGTTYIRGNIDPKRFDAVDVHERMHRMFDSIAQSYGHSAKHDALKHLTRHIEPIATKYVKRLIGRIHPEGLDPVSFKEEHINYLHSFLADPTARERMLRDIKSPFHRRLIDKSIKRSWQKLIHAASTMTESDLPSYFNLTGNVNDTYKAIDDSEWSAFSQQHVPDYIDDVDHEFHTANAKTPKHYLESLISPKPMKHINIGGEFPKLIHDVSEYIKPDDPSYVPSHVMIKPYHHRIDRFINYADKPIGGWAAMATKSLFDSAGVGHLAENVTADIHNGIPLTIHSFAPKHFQSAMRTLIEDVRSRPPDLPADAAKYNHKPNPLHVQQIAVMDYLTSNRDRHGNNMLVSTEADDSGYNPILAIDHGLSFQYQKGIATPGYYVDNSTPLRVAFDASGADKDWSALVGWWRDNSENIRKEFERQIFAIKNPTMRAHIQKNFAQRWHYIDQWATDNTPYNYQECSLFDYRMPSHNVIPMDDVMDTAVKEVHAALPNDKIVAANTVIDLATKHPKRKGLFRKVVKELMTEMSDDEFANFLITHHNNVHLDIKNIAIDMLFVEGGDMNNRLRKFLDRLKTMPEDFQEQFPFWGERLEETRKLGE